MTALGSKECPDCHRLSELYWERSAELERSKDELARTKKNDPAYSVKKANVLRLEGLVKDARIQASNHLEIHRSSN
jgi:hypothetical protein